MSKEITDDDIIKQFQESANELPPKALDTLILSHSAQALRKKNNLISLKDKLKASTLPYAGLAAAIAAVVVLSPWQFKNSPLLMNEPIKSTEQSPSREFNLKPSFSKPAVMQEQLSKTQESGSSEDTLTLTPKQNMHAHKVLSGDLKSTQGETKSLNKMEVFKTKKSTANPNKTEQQALKKINTLLDKNNYKVAEKQLRALIKARPNLAKELPKRLELFYKDINKNNDNNK